MYADALGLGGAEGQGRMDRHPYLAFQTPPRAVSLGTGDPGDG